MDSFEIIKKIKTENTQYLHFQFDDLLGRCHESVFDVESIDENLFFDGIKFDYSKIDFWSKLSENDLLLMPDPKTAKFSSLDGTKILTLICDVFDQRTGELYNLYPRTTLRKAIDYLDSSGLNDTAFIFNRNTIDSNMKKITLYTHQWNDDQNLFEKEDSREIFKIAYHALNGIYRHMKTIKKFSFAPDDAIPFELYYGMNLDDNNYCFEISSMHPGYNYLGFSAMIMAMIDGIKNQVEDDNNHREQFSALKNNDFHLADFSSFNSVAEATSNDFKWLKLGDVFSDDLVEIML